MQERRNSTADALELRLSCTKASKFWRQYILKRKCCHFGAIRITDFTGSCHFDNFHCSPWWKFRQNEDIAVSGQLNVDISETLTKPSICVVPAVTTFGFQYLGAKYWWTKFSLLPCVNYANPAYGAATICHQVRWLRWGHPSLFHTATSLLIWYNMFCVRDISYRLIWMEFINMFSVQAQSGTHSRFNW